MRISDRLLGLFKGRLIASVVVVFIFCTVSAATAGTAADFSVYGGVKGFFWRECHNDFHFLEESGVISGIGVAGEVYSCVHGHLVGNMRGEFFGGRVGYNGQTWGGNPVETDVDYSGFKVEGDFGYCLEVGKNVFVGPLLGFGYRQWYRNIISTPTATGYLERWESLYRRLGVHGGYNISEVAAVSMKAGIRMPDYNRNKVELPFFGDVTLKPGRETSAFAEAVLRYEWLRASLFYEGMRFSRSPAVHVDGHTFVYQPESKADIFGLSAGVRF